ncbi:uncharacterized protein METZ01_LOCUS242051, partial [marine metagenome]
VVLILMLDQLAWQWMSQEEGIQLMVVLHRI